MGNGFLDTTDLGLLAWSQNFYATGNPIATAIGLSAGQFTTFNGMINTYSADLAACDPGVRNKAAVLQKNESKSALAQMARALARVVEAHPGVTNAQRAELGLNVRAMPTPIPRPAFPPQVDLIGIDGHTVSVRFHDSQAAGKRGRPKGIKGAAVFSYVGTSAPADPTLYRFEGNTSKTSVDVVFPSSVAPGTTVFVTAAWCNERLEGGPIGTPAQAVIQYGTGASATPPAVAG